MLVTGLRNLRGLLKEGEHDQAQGGEVLCAPEVFVTTVTKGFEEMAGREIYGPPTPSLGVDPGTGV